MAASRKRSPRQTRPPRSWRSIALGIGKWFLVSLVALETIAMPFAMPSESSTFGLLSMTFILTLTVTSLVYLYLVSSMVHLRLPDIDASTWAPEEGTASDAAGSGRSIARSRRRTAANQDAERGRARTVQVSRLDTHASRVTIVNEAPLPVLRAEASPVLVHEETAEDTSAVKEFQQVESWGFSIPAHSARTTTTLNVFDHVGICVVSSAGVRVYGLLGVLSRVHEKLYHLRVRVVPNVYRLAYGVPRERKTSQDSLGIPDHSADAMDYDRVREYRPGDPLKTIHWKIVAHSQGELYTKLFETSTASGVTLMIDPFGPSVKASSLDAVYHLYDTMLEGGFSLVEHARENGIPARLRFVNRAGNLVETSWKGPGSLGWFVETAQRPQCSEEAAERSTQAIMSLRDGRAGYVIFATSCLTGRSVRELVDCHQAGVSLLVVHALPKAPSPEATNQRSLDARLREASIGVVELYDGPQIVREVMPS